MLHAPQGVVQVVAPSVDTLLRPLFNIRRPAQLSFDGCGRGVGAIVGGVGGGDVVGGVGGGTGVGGVVMADI